MIDLVLNTAGITAFQMSMTGSDKRRAPKRAKETAMKRATIEATNTIHHMGLLLYGMMFESRQERSAWTTAIRVLRFGAVLPS